MMMRLMGALIVLISVWPTQSFAEPAGEFTVRFQQPYNSFEDCVLNQFIAQSPISFKHVEVDGAVRYSSDRLGNTNKFKVVVPILAVTQSNHPMLLDLGLIAAYPHEWRRASTGGKPYFLASAVDLRMPVSDAVSGDFVFQAFQDCPPPDRL